ncbi:hypothetical protein [Atopomonas sediminilitoris]|uniref:hypothetical protein n=1 Tax=Atopomonas sediminilitoris TaxID=2919919 RepID=UPI001F4DD123|nr:hypothetical protein [Atopomonas sediminilitoris]MCJ8167684.1 hypothetical protein [Atopomonas sediminilitoris]
MKKATRPVEQSRPRKAESISSVLHTFALDCTFGLLIALTVFGCVWLAEVLA